MQEILEDTHKKLEEFKEQGSIERMLDVINFFSV